MFSKLIYLRIFSTTIKIESELQESEDYLGNYSCIDSLIKPILLSYFFDQINT